MTANKKTLILSIIGVAIFIVLVFSISYAFYTTNFDSNKDGKNNTVTGTTAKISTSFEDGETIDIDDMFPGTGFTKTFTVENSSNTDIKFKIVINELVNEFDSFEDITYVLKENEKTIKNGIFPKNPEENDLSDDITLEKGEKKTYSIEVTYVNTEENQVDDMGKVISGKIFIKEV